MLTTWVNTCYHRAYENIRGRNSVVECRLPKPNAVGSNPIARFFFHREEKGSDPFSRSGATAFKFTMDFFGYVGTQVYEEYKKNHPDESE